MLRPAVIEEFAGREVTGVVRSRPSEARAIAQYGTQTRQAVVVDVPQYLSHRVTVGTHVLLDFDETGRLHGWRVAPQR